MSDVTTLGHFKRRKEGCSIDIFYNIWQVINLFIICFSFQLQVMKFFAAQRVSVYMHSRNKLAIAPGASSGCGPVALAAALPQLGLGCETGLYSRALV